jgi:hypothetical protein
MALLTGGVAGSAAPASVAVAGAPLGMLLGILAAAKPGGATMAFAAASTTTGAGGVPGFAGVAGVVALDELEAAGDGTDAAWGAGVEACCAVADGPGVTGPSSAAAGVDAALPEDALGPAFAVAWATRAAELGNGVAAGEAALGIAAASCAIRTAAEGVFGVAAEPAAPVAPASACGGDPAVEASLLAGVGAAVADPGTGAAEAAAVAGGAAAAPVA